MMDLPRRRNSESNDSDKRYPNLPSKSCDEQFEYVESQARTDRPKTGFDHIKENAINHPVVSLGKLINSHFVYVNNKTNDIQDSWRLSEHSL